jgi:hypothetical protein
MRGSKITAALSEILGILFQRMSAALNVLFFK